MYVNFVLHLIYRKKQNVRIISSLCCSTKYRCYNDYIVTNTKFGTEK